MAFHLLVMAVPEVANAGRRFYLVSQGLGAWSGCLFVPGLVEGAEFEHGAQDVDAAAGSNDHDLWIGLGMDAKGVPSRVIDFWSSSRPTLRR
ncbi:hypothetical protein ABIE67_009235 [Streptomyces sp. V4I8]|uniref:hypothetical protein n=1 Tax=Streptomyces sp. V4I8 TaxID=3156469 RepID=UPI003513334A